MCCLFDQSDAEDDQSLRVNLSKANDLLGVCLRACHALSVRDSADPLARQVAQTIILLSISEELDHNELYKRTIDSVGSNLRRQELEN